MGLSGSDLILKMRDRLRRPLSDDPIPIRPIRDPNIQLRFLNELIDVEGLAEEVEDPHELKDKESHVVLLVTTDLDHRALPLT